MMRIANTMKKYSSFNRRKELDMEEYMIFGKTFYEVDGRVVCEQVLMTKEGNFIHQLVEKDIKGTIVKKEREAIDKKKMNWLRQSWGCDW